MSVSMIRPLLDYLASGAPRGSGGWRDWQITRITDGRNNLLYRASGPQGHLAIKFTVRDERDRAGREYGALAALRQAGLSVAPEPILLDRTSYAQPVVVQSWLEGEVSDTPPSTDDEWQKLVQHLACIHTVTPQDTRMQLPWATINANTAGEGMQRVREQMIHIPSEAQPTSLRTVLGRLEASRLPEWPKAPVALCRLDNNIANYIRCVGPWASVDWEYSGWGDPAFDVANLVTHVAFQGVGALRWKSFIDHYCSLVEDESANVRIQVYRNILLVWWAARLARYLYELPRGQDRRLAEWPAGWQVDIEAKYQHYLGLAEAACSRRK
jgi:aminoglycoside phosphotransferase (APT) family kinase protein